MCARGSPIEIAPRACHGPGRSEHARVRISISSFRMLAKLYTALYPDLVSQNCASENEYLNLSNKSRSPMNYVSNFQYRFPAYHSAILPNLIFDY